MQSLTRNILDNDFMQLLRNYCYYLAQSSNAKFPKAMQINWPEMLGEIHDATNQRSIFLKMKW